MNLHGTISVTSAQLVEELKEEPASPTAASPTAAAPASPTPMDTSEDAKKKAEADAAAGKKDDGAKPASDKEKADKEKADKEKADKEKADKEAAEKAKKKIRRVDLKVVAFPCWGIDQKQLTAYFEKEAAMANADRLIAETNEARNALEGFVLDMRNRVSSGDLKEFIRAAPREEFLSALTSVRLISSHRALICVCLFSFPPDCCVVCCNMRGWVTD